MALMHQKRGAAVLPYVEEIITKGTARMGRKQLWRLSATLRSIPSCNIHQLREVLRHYGIFLEDASYAACEEHYQSYDTSSTEARGESGQLTLVTAFMLDLIGALHPRRRHVLNLMLKALGVKGAEDISAEKPDGLLEEVPLGLIASMYDVLRHPSIANAVDPLTEEEIQSKYVTALDFEGHGSAIAVEELMLYYLGVGTTLSDTDFELLCIRSFSLDRPRLNFEDEQNRLKGSTAVAHFNRLVGKPHSNPLYTTTYEDYGKEIKGGKPPPMSRYGRSYKFSKSIPHHTGGATSINM